MKDKLIDGKELQIGLEVANGNKFDECSISPKIGQILLHWGYELTEKKNFIDLIN